MSDVMLAAAVILEENTPLSAKSQNKNNLSTQNNNFSTQNNFTTQNNYSEKNNFSTQNNINNINNLNNLSSNNNSNMPSSKHDQTLRGNSCGTSLCYNTASSSSSFSSTSAVKKDRNAGHFTFVITNSTLKKVDIDELKKSFLRTHCYDTGDDHNPSIKKGKNSN